MTTMMLRTRATAATTTLLRARPTLAGRGLPTPAPPSSLNTLTARQLSNRPASMLRSVILSSRSTSLERQSSTLTSTKPTPEPKPEPDFSTNHSETHYGRIDCEDRAPYFWIAAPILVILIPFALSYDHDKELTDLAKSQDKAGGLGESVRKALKLDHTKDGQKKEGEGEGPSKTMLNSIWRRRMAEKASKSYQYIMSMSAVTALPQAAQDKISEVILTANQWYVNQPAGKLAVVPIMALNTGVFLMWVVAKRRPRWEAWMWRNFSDQDLSWRRPWTMFTHTVSHSSSRHFLFSQWAIWTIGGGAVQLWQDHIVEEYKKAGVIKHMPTEVDYSYQVTAVFLFSALFGRLVSRSLSKATMQRLMRKLQTMPPLLAHQARRELGELYAKRGMGSTAGIYGLFACSAFLGTVLKGPHNLELPFLSAEQHPTMWNSFLTLTFLELICLTLGARRFDHAAHLTAAGWGIVWMQVPSYWWAIDRELVSVSILNEESHAKNMRVESEERAETKEKAHKGAAAKLQRRAMMRAGDDKEAQLMAEAARQRRAKAAMELEKANMAVMAAARRFEQAKEQVEEAVEQWESKMVTVLELLSEDEIASMRSKVDKGHEAMWAKLELRRNLRKKEATRN